MKTFKRFVLLPLLWMGSGLLAQEDLLVRSLTKEIRPDGPQPVEEVLYYYDNRQQLVSEVHLQTSAGSGQWMQEYEIDYNYDDVGQVTGQEKRFYDDRLGQLQVHDRLTWTFDEAGQQTSYQLIRTRPLDDTEEGFLYTYTYDDNGCQTERIGYSWSKASETFRAFDRVVTIPTRDCLPSVVESFNVDSVSREFTLSHSHRYAYEFDSLDRPVSEITYRTDGATGDKELVSEFRIAYGDGFDIRTYHRIPNNYRYEALTTYDESDQPVYRRESSNVYSGAAIEPTQETIWTYDSFGRQILKKRFQIWNSERLFWESVTIDSVQIANQMTERFKIRETWTAPDTRLRRHTTVSSEMARCDGNPELLNEHFYQDGFVSAHPRLTEFGYAGSAACNPVEPDLWQLDVFPVPATNKLHVRSPLLSAGNTRVRLLNTQGATVMEKQTAFAHGLMLDVSGLSGGIYVLVIDVNKIIVYRKVLIE